MEEKVRMESLPPLVSLKAVQRPLLQVCREQSIRLAHKAHTTIHCQRPNKSVANWLTKVPGIAAADGGQA